MPRILSSVLLVSIVVLSCTAASYGAPSPSWDPSKPAAGRDTVVIGTTLEPATLHPLFARGPTIEWHIMSALFTRDVRRDSTWRASAYGAEYLPNVLDGTWKVSGEQMTLTWRIKPRNWHDGRPVTCSDYAFTYQAARDERLVVVTSERRTTVRVTNVSCPQGAGGRTIVVTWKGRYAYANLGIPYLIGPLPRHILEPFYRANPAKFPEAPYGTDPRSTISDGAYRLVEWRSGESLTIEAVRNHPIFGSPQIRRIIWKFVRDPDRLVRDLAAGTIDVISSEGLTFDGAMALTREGQDRIQVLFESGLVWEHIDFNLDNPLLQDVRVRRAMAHGINRTQIAQQLFGGRQPVAHSYLAPRHLGYTDRVPRYAYDPARARALLREAGFSPGSDGIMVNRAGQRLSLELNTTTGVTLRERTARIVQEQLQQIGIELTIVNFDRRLLFSQLMRRKFSALLLYAWIFAPWDDCDLYYTGDAIPSEANNWFGLNYPGYRNPEMDGICKAISRELDDAKRTALLHESARIFARDLPALPLFFRLALGASKRGLQNFSVPGLGDTFDTWNAHLWYWK